MRVTHIHIAKVPIKKEHFNWFCLITSTIMCGLDWAHAQFFPHAFEHLEALFSNGGKYGAFFGLLPAIIEQLVKPKL